MKIEQDLMPVTPRKEWGNLSHLLIFHGRAVCQAKETEASGVRALRYLPVEKYIDHAL